MLARRGADLLRDEGIDALTLRALAEMTGCSAATVQYHFGSKERLLADAYRELQSRYMRRLREDRAFLLTHTTGPEMLPGIMRSILDLGGSAERREQLALLDLLAAELRAPGGGAEAGGWTEALVQFWRELAATFAGTAALANFLFELHLGLMIHFSGVVPSIEGRLLAAEIVDRALSPAPRTEPIWFREMLRGTLALADPAWARLSDKSPKASAIADAAAALAAEQGPGAVSYRSVALRAGTSVSAVTHHFPTRDKLLHAAYRALHEKIISFTRSRGVAADPDYLPDVAEEIVTHTAGGAVPLLLAYSEFELMASRTAEFADLARYFRMTRGLYHTRIGDPAFDPFGREAFDSFALSIWIVGHSLNWALGQRGSCPKDGAIAFGFRQFGLS